MNDRIIPRQATFTGDLTYDPDKIRDIHQGPFAPGPPPQWFVRPNSGENALRRVLHGDEMFLPTNYAFVEDGSCYPRMVGFDVGVSTLEIAMVVTNAFLSRKGLFITLKEVKP